MNIPLSIAIGVLLSSIYPGETMALAGLLILIPGILYGKLARQGVLKRNRVLHFSVLALVAYGILMVGTARILNLPQLLMSLMYLFAVLLILAVLVVTFREARRAPG